MQGQGLYTYNDGSRYVGQFFNSQREGSGIFKFVNTSFYNRISLINLGCRYSNGDVYVGQWKCNKRHGQVQPPPLPLPLPHI